MRSSVYALAAILPLLHFAAPAQAPAPPAQSPASPQRRALAPPPAWPATTINPDGSITFRLKYPTATKVAVATDALLQPLTMTLGSDGVWTAATPSLAPEYYGYTFVVDGVKILDPLNRNTHVNFVDLYSDILVPGAPPRPWELTDIPHGDVTRHLCITPRTRLPTWSIRRPGTTQNGKAATPCCICCTVFPIRKMVGL